MLGTKNLAEILSERETISQVMQNALDEATDPWGVKVIFQFQLWKASSASGLSKTKLFSSLLFSGRACGDVSDLHLDFQKCKMLDETSQKVSHFKNSSQRATFHSFYNIASKASLNSEKSCACFVYKKWRILVKVSC